ncbi:bifunctional 2-C-methyl-D-erythritol 4-phosphate cytidylyltransferase/2-C-methyl-D-erythritol 2,4-cyclodiphosphate synthase [Loktanella sp. SALINAS62]|uniref:bifunctional 2-C-methyl-D-erythritol 4-phosphate cytidylyltransferase/2-C-methyl-D-erythritol 2,4-cyclodiphosphate synthase n=1 Tax=Loktanella sp. SALINAS62 TaxID=2706124 RepID=UPI001B8A9F33|nr:bifunctional 2-C-methyl-D-erythritol 4-phosphate cytidylyltransferase/2-C-methyl-D-erythritol 2,4-cyclodiphosphate synthase [Loktanella sp. SALINAS62]MBS1303625.1 bifunctional 2-C-methyl-D-erythritol 4-phosphate cytidylyltransferase/2-C-methyl-D-erythritol 2,4-cyclodiphosphate synthase [Loktanella sp. SALINAS62]
MTRIAAIIVAAGRGLRAGGGLPKQWRDLAGRPVIDRTIAAFSTHPAITQVIVVLHPDDMHRLRNPDVICVAGGSTRQESVLAGLRATDAERVLIHDAARPLVSAALIDRVCAMLDHHTGAAPALAVTDALWRGDTLVTGLQDRDGLHRAQTPQGFDRAAILAAHLAAPAGAADDVAVALAAGLDVAIVAGDEDNIKITHADDFIRAAQRLENHMDVRLGNGYDVHRFGPGDHVVLCGVAVPFDRGLQGHSDADVGMHAVTDAIYGALGQGDIGVHFPPSDPQWKGAESQIFLRHAATMARDAGFAISNVDCTLVCEFPKIGPHQSAMRAAMAAILGIDSTRVSVKATTSEQLGFTGRGEGIAALATAALVAS